MRSPLACQGEKNQNETERWSSDKAHEVGLYSLWKFDSSEEIVFSSITAHASYW
jgi:hypothetical protein